MEVRGEGKREVHRTPEARVSAPSAAFCRENLFACFAAARSPMVPTVGTRVCPLPPPGAKNDFCAIARRFIDILRGTLTSAEVGESLRGTKLIAVYGLCQAVATF